MLEYRTIKDFSNYLIGNNGEVYNKQTNHRKIPTSNKTGKGYLYVDLYNSNKHARKYIHYCGLSKRLSYTKDYIWQYVKEREE